MDRKEFARFAIEARKFSYSPYSGFQVGAALLAADGRIFTGTNVECCSYSPTNCAERTAIFKAVSEGCTKFKAIAIAGGFSNKPPEYCYPCGVCLQVINEFADDGFIVLIVKSEDDWKEHKFSELLPYGFGPDDLKKEWGL